MSGQSAPVPEPAPEPVVVATYALSTTKRQHSMLVGHRPHVERVRIVRTPGPATVYLDWPESAPVSDRAARLFDFAQLVDQGLCRGTRVLKGRAEEVVVRDRHLGPEVTGPAVEVFVDRRRPTHTDTEVCFDGMDPGGATRAWIVDAIVSAAWHLVETTGE